MGQYQKSYYSFFEVPEEKIMVQKKIPRETVVEIFWKSAKDLKLQTEETKQTLNSKLWVW